MKCPRCQHENRPGAKFCEECAAALARHCTNCGADIGPAAKFCAECAHPTGTGTTTPPTRFATPDAYTPKHLAERILTSKAALEGERKQVTILFADLKGSMELLADRDPEEARKILDPVLERMMEAVHHYEGTVNQVMGDGIMALFGAPLAHEDHAVRACYAALRMKDAIKRYSDGVRRVEGIPIRIRVGLNSGEVVVRAIGSDLHMDYTAVGQTTHLAARMEQIADPGTVLLTPNTLALAEGFVEVRSVGPTPVKGLATPIDVYELTGVTVIRSRLQAAVARGLTKFVGRSAEMAQLHEALDLARSGHGQVLAVVGEPGVGKSRLYWEFTQSRRTDGCLVVEAASVSYGKATAYLPLIELLKSYFAIESRDDVRKIREKVTGKALSLDRALEPSLPALLALLDVPIEDAEWSRLDPPQRRRRTLDGVKRLLLRESQVQPLVLVFEDLHWIDGETQTLLDALVESVPTARLLLLVNYRPEYRHDWGGKTYYRQARIDPLPPAPAGELLDALLGRDAGLAPLKRLLVDHTEGNPFFLEECVRTLVETGALAGERGTYRLVSAVTSLRVPTTAQAILAARIDRLAPEDKRLLQAAAVVGKSVPLVLLQAISDESDDALRAGIARLQAAEFLYEARLFPDVEYTFKHALTHEVTYAGLLHDRRRNLHAQLVGAIEAHYQRLVGDQIELLAHHAFRGELWEKAATYLRQAGAKAFTRSANRQAVTCYEQALSALSHLPETRQALEQVTDLRFDLRTALFPLGEMDQILVHLREAERLARNLDDQRRLGWVAVYIAHYSQATGDARRARESADAAWVLANRLEDFSLQVAARFYLGWSAYTLGDYRAAETDLRSVVALLEGDRRCERCNLTGFPAVLARWILAMCLAARGALAEGITVGQDGIRLAEELDHAYSLILACWGPVDAYELKAEVVAAIRLGERALALCRDWSISGLSPLVKAFLGRLYARSGRIADGLTLLDEARTAIESMRGGSSWDAKFRVHLGEAYAGAGRLDEASRITEQALALARQRGHRGFEAYAFSVLGEIASLFDPTAIEPAQTHYRQALAIAEELGMRPLVAHCHAGLAKLCRRADKQHRAYEHFATAMSMYREMGMTYWLEKVQRETNGLEIDR